MNHLITIILAIVGVRPTRGYNVMRMCVSAHYNNVIDDRGATNVEVGDA